MQTLAPWAHAAAGIAPSKSELVKRARRILDANRLIQLRTSHKLAAAIALIAALITTATGIIGAESSGEFRDGRLIGPINGTVYSSAGKPIGDAAVEFGEWIMRNDGTADRDWKSLAKTSTATDGTYVFESQQTLQRVSDCQLRISAPGFGREVVMMYTDEAHPLRFSNSSFGYGATADCVLWPADSVQGRIVDRAGEPVAGAAITHTAIDVPVITDAKGRFTLQNIANRRMDGSTKKRESINLKISHPDFATSDRYTAKGDMQNLVIKIDSGATIEGTVRDRQTGSGVPGFRIIAKSEGQSRSTSTATTDKDGKFRVRTAPGQITIKAVREQLMDPLANNYIPVKEEDTVFAVEGDTKTGVNIAVTKGQVLRGRVTDSVTKAPVEGITVELVPASRPRDQLPYWDIRSARTGADGQFAIGAIAPGSYSCESPSDDDEAGIRKQSVEILASEEPKPIELVAIRKLLAKGEQQKDMSKHGLPVAGVVLLPDGRPASMAKVRHYFGNEKGGYPFWCRPDGSFLITVPNDAASGPVLLRCADFDQKLAATVELPNLAAVQQPLVIKLHEGAQFSGTVRDESGRPMEGITVGVMRHLSTAAGGSVYSLSLTTTDAEGRYVTPPFVPSSRDVAATLECMPLSQEFARSYIWPVKPEGRYTDLNLVPGAYTKGLDFTLTIENREHFLEACFVAKPAKAE